MEALQTRGPVHIMQRRLEVFSVEKYRIHNVPDHVHEKSIIFFQRCLQCRQEGEEMLFLKEMHHGELR